jgi:cytochrome c biogenesis protein CcdA
VTALTHIARDGARMVRQSARKAALSAALLGAALVTFAITLGFAGLGLFLILELRHDPIVAAFGVATAGLLLVALLIFAATRAAQSSHAHQSQPPATESEKPDHPRPETTAAVISAGFLNGLLTGRG